MHLFFLKKKKIINNKGFTLIEVMIAVALFVVIMIYGIGAVLSANATHKKSQALQTIMDEVSFAMEEMSRNLRLGSGYACGVVNTINATSPGGGVLTGPAITNIQNADCPALPGALSVLFESMNGDSASADDQFVYAVLDDPTTPEPNFRIYKSTDSGQTFYPITPAIVHIDGEKSGFIVEGSGDYAGGDTKQPRVIVRVSGTILIKNTATPFDIQTTVSQRLIDA